MALVMAFIFIGTCYMAYQLGAYDRKHGREDK
jgi:hypothetical protein